MKIIIGDMNAKIGKENDATREVMGKHGCGIINENGEMTREFCVENGLIIGGTLFPYKESHKKDLDIPRW